MSDDTARPVAVWRCPRCGYDRVEYAGDDPDGGWLCEDVCRGPAYAQLNPAVDRQLERILVVPLADAQRATALAERYGETIIRISATLTNEDLNPNGRIMRARGHIVALDEAGNWPALTEAHQASTRA